MNIINDTHSASPAVIDNGREVVVDNPVWHTHPHQKLSILVPSYKDDPEPLLTALEKCYAVVDIELIVYDDGGGNDLLIEKLSSCAADLSYPIRIVSASKNTGRSCARNRLLHYARSDWVLLLDADMIPDKPDFISNYIFEIEKSAAPKLVVGGFSLKQASTAREFAIHRWQAEQSECVPAEIRSTEPGRYVFTSNVLVHASVFEHTPFDESFSGWGWEDVDWGLRVAQAFPIIHLDNTATHLGLDRIEDLLKKYGGSGPNFRKAVEKHPDTLQTTNLYVISNKLKPLPFKPLAKKALSLVMTIQLLPIPIKMRGNALKLWRAIVCAEALNEKR
ncbi:glycosyltransferase family 2 protein [Hirschia litorea]|uniref:Glycosyltransferase family 2 protein n=1 Tax=Hirschia litorea TaxID=1199156 RepID=A0ABW2IGL3_9PROT